jgi:ferredoxin-NADP reductase
MEFTSLTVNEVRNETQEYRSIIFQKPKNFNFTLGECFSLRFPGEDSFKVFSFASSPTEDRIVISYKKGISRFKKQLDNLHTGDQMEVSLYGSQFHFDAKKSSVFIAGGIGITAFRSIITYCVDKNIRSPIHLLFCNRNDMFPFQDDLTYYLTQLPHLHITYVSTNKEGRLTTEKIKKVITDYNDEFYLAGPPLMIDSTVELLQSCGINSNQIHTESFDGYSEEV